MVNQKYMNVCDDEVEVGKYTAVIFENIRIESLKAAESLCEKFETQLMNYLKATNNEVGWVMNFGKSAQFKRKIFDNNYKFKTNTIHG